MFEEVRQRIESRMARWAEQFLSQAGKEILIKVVAMPCDVLNFLSVCVKTWRKLLGIIGRGGMAVERASIGLLGTANNAEMQWRLGLQRYSMFQSRPSC